MYSLPFVSSFQYSLNILIPILVVLKSEIAFFTLISFYLVILFGMYIYNFFFFLIKERIFKGTSNLVLLLFHIFFLIIFTADRMNTKQRSEMVNACLIAGISVIFLVFIGGCVELLDFVIGSIIFIIKSIIKCIKFVKKMIIKHLDKKKQR